MQKRKKICLITSVPEGCHQQRAAEGMFAQCEKYGYHAAVFGTMTHVVSVNKGYTHGESNIYELINYHLFDGVIVDTAPLIGDETCTLIDKVLNRLKRECTKPVISLEFPLDNYPVSENCNEEILREMCRHVVEVHHCKDILLLTGQKGNTAAESRLTIFLDELKQHGILVPENRIVYGDFWYTSGEQLAKNLLEGKLPMPEAVIAASDHMALGMMESLSNHGIRIPEDLIVVSFGATPEALINDIPLSSYEANDAQTAADAVDYLRSIIEPDAEILPYTPNLKKVFHPGMSCGCQQDYVSSARAFKDALCLMTRNYSSAFLNGHIDMGSLMESYVSERFTAAETPEECIKAIFNSTYLLRPYEKFFLCLKSDWLGTSSDIIDGYPEQMKMTAVSSSDGEQGFFREEDAFLFDTSLMLPQMHEPSETPSAFYFSAVHFNEKMLGYSVLQKSLNDPNGINLVYRNWLRFVNNALEMIRVQKCLMQMSVRDEMTGAYNRRGMYLEFDRLLHEAGEKDSVFACVIDMDGLKFINDNFGHNEGDSGIWVVSQAASAVTGEHEILVRAGGDEFYILGVGKYEETEINRRIAEFTAVMDSLAVKAGKSYPLTASIGCAVRPLNSEYDMNEALREADKAMYRHKTERKCHRTD